MTSLGPDTTTYLDLYDDKLAIDYGAEDAKPLVMDLPSGEDRELVGKLITDVNFWMQFLNSLSAAIAQNKKV